ncbi:calcineurin-binding protein cabin-1-like [Eupeodes corollae]|uniref:calcineurin-binding protein cabin-1-like n=1 Tax=Eupeodes corollae TaxID=290404 RepID=UPI0024930C42|nr:calcineurin-binding protein cabin-1-like [Eupeodes corollae]XP_055915860.1 calcineurin-binding protein cabin-1-like [Eupeodes corollae]
MMKIVALNESESEDEAPDETIVTDEAQETIAETEYMRALKYKGAGKPDLALSLMLELLETRVLNEVCMESNNEKLLAIRYNCHKNIALIYEEKKEFQKSLDHFMQAIHIDDTDVYTMHRLGQLALRLHVLDIADYAFEKCLKRNPNHWSAADGILQVMCLNQNFMGAYGWALKWYLKDNKYERALDVLTEMTENFPDLIEFYQTIWSTPFVKPKGRTSKGKKSVFPEARDIPEKDTKMVKPDLEQFRVKQLDWLSIGKYIISVYNHLHETKQCLFFILSVDDFLEQPKDEDNEKPMRDTDPNPQDVGLAESNENSNEPSSNSNQSPASNSQQEESASSGNDAAVFIAPSTDNIGSRTPQQGNDSNAEDSDTNAKQETETSKPKPRRRCSDLSFLEQWGWHKNRRHTSRKKSQQDRPEIDTTLNGFLKRIFGKFTDETFEDEWPFKSVENDEKCPTSERQPSVRKLSSEKLASFEEFQSETQDDFIRFLEKMKSRPFDLILLIFRWLKFVSKYWDKSMGDEMKDAYHEICSYYLSHYELVTWNQLSNDNFNASYRMCMFFMELDLEKSIKSDSEISALWQKLFTHLSFNSGCAYVISDDLYERNIIRLIHMEYCWAKYENRLSQCVESLQHLEELISEQSEDFSLELPNMKEELNYLDRETVKVTRTETQRKIGLNKVRDLYEQKQWKELIVILKDSLIHSKEVKDSEAWVKDLQTQFEVLLESIWQTGDFEECLIWAERCMQYAVAKYTGETGETYRQRKWAENINYIFTYLEALILNEGSEILDHLEKYLPRLVQNIIKLLAHQLDAPFDKNNNAQHPLEIKRPWVVLHQVLLREEHNSPIVIKTRPLDVTMDTEEIEDLLPHSFLTLFTAHEFLGKRQWCTRDSGQLLLYTIEMIAPNLRAPLYDSCRDIVMEYMEQTTYCLYGYPPKKARSRHIEEHEATSVELTWQRAIQLFDLYRPENLPEFNSYKLESISADMEQLLLKIVPLIPKEMDPTTVISNIHDFISGSRDSLPDDCVLLPYRISCIYYLLADYYFKSRDFSKTLKYYPLDLACHPDRFDSWAGMALSKASKIETKLNGFLTIENPAFMNECEDTIRCFKQCTKLNHEQVLVWIEYGSFAYTLHSFCSRDLKHSSDTLSLEQFTAVEDRKENFLKIANDCFTKGDVMLQNQTEDENDDDNDSHDEKWLNQYMLGKIGEKRKEQPSIYMNHYLKAANYLYENNATYPIKINHSNPTTLSVEALEMFYRTNAAIIKFLEHDKEISREVGDLFNQILNNLANSPFAFNKAKIDDNSLNAFKRKIADKVESNAIKQAKLEEVAAAAAAAQTLSQPLSTEPIIENVAPTVLVTSPTSATVTPVIVETQKEPEPALPKPATATMEVIESAESINTGNVTAATSKATSPSRRASQESSATNSSSTATGTTSSASSSSTSDSSSSDSDSSDSESSSTDDGKKRDKNSPYSEHELEAIYRSCVRNLEECVTRFPEHYKSVYRLVHHYLHAPEKFKDLEKCRQLLLGQYTTNLGNQINGLFSDRKNNNIFNGIWRIPSSEIDRPGSFSSHLVKCVSILIQVLRKSNNHKLLIDVALQLYRTPDNDKRYIKDSERMELYQQAMTFCVQIMRNILKNITETRDNVETLNLLIDIYKAHKKCIKHMNQKEPLFIQLLVDVYKFYIQDKVVKMPENLNLVDLAIKLCLQEISVRKNQEKQALAGGASGQQQPATIVTSGSGEIPPIGPKPAVTTANVPPIINKTIQIPGITSRARGRPVGSKNTPPQVSVSSFQQQQQQQQQQPTVSSASIQAASNLINQTSLASLMSIYTNPTMTNSMTTDQAAFQKLVAEYYALLGGPAASAASLLPNLAAPSMNPILNPLAALQPPKTPTTPNIPESSPPISTAKIPQFDIKNLIASAASQVSKTATSSHNQSTTINIGGGELTITPTSSKVMHPKEPTTGSSKLSTSMPSTASSISVTKVPAHSPNIYVKPLSDMTSILPPKLPELPKSLSITPSTNMFPVEKSRAQKIPNMSMIPELKIPDKPQGKAKSSSKKKPVQQTPYSRPPSVPPSNPTNPATTLAGLTTAELASLASINPQFPLLSHFSMDNYNQQAAMLTQYADLLKRMGTDSSMVSQIAQMSQFQQFQMLGQKRPYAKRNRQPKPKKPTQDIHAAVESALKSLSPQITMIPSTSKTPKQPFNMKTYNSPATLTSVGPPPPSMSMSAPPQGGRITPKTIPTPPPSITPGLQQTSPVKTLQQKLAERQKANQQMNENAQKPGSSGGGGGGTGGGGSNSSSSSSSGGGKRGKIDVIILD